MARVPGPRTRPDLLVDRMHWSGSPYESINLFKEAEVFARAEGRTGITVVDMQDVFDTFSIDQYGLRWEDHQILGAMFARPRYRVGRGKNATPELVGYGGSEGDICSVAGIHPAEYRETIKPRLMSRHLIEVRSGIGQALLPSALELYAHLKPPRAAS